jgi:outer membrane receptor protein involved in Fe transport
MATSATALRQAVYPACARGLTCAASPLQKSRISLRPQIINPESRFSVFSQPYIRGIGSDLLSIGADPAVATFVDGVYQSRAVEAYQHLFDVERVEILKGPQGTLYGCNATGGAVHIISKPLTLFFLSH